MANIYKLQYFPFFLELFLLELCLRIMVEGQLIASSFLSVFIVIDFMVLLNLEGKCLKCGTFIVGANFFLFWDFFKKSSFFKELKFCSFNKNVIVCQKLH